MAFQINAIGGSSSLMGNECSGPMTIEAAVYSSWPSGSPNLLHHRSFEGYCENILQGRVNVELWVGQCHDGYTLGDAYTGWRSVSRIMIVSVYSSWPSGSPNLLHHRSFEGYCENIPQGRVTVELWVGQCPTEPLGDAYTGWQSVSRIMIEEVSRAQS